MARGLRSHRWVGAVLPCSPAHAKVGRFVTQQRQKLDSCGCLSPSGPSGLQRPYPEGASTGRQAETAPGTVQMRCLACRGPYVSPPEGPLQGAPIPGVGQCRTALDPFTLLGDHTEQ